jgi:hypothetical protein
MHEYTSFELSDLNERRTHLKGAERIRVEL